MKSNQLMKMSLAAVSALILGLSVAKAGDQPQYKEVQVGISDAYIPGGFDADADAYVVASGVFPNGCYRWSRAEVNNKDLYTHEIKSVANVEQGMCIMVLVPFTKEIRLGKLQTGKHALRFLNGDGTYLEKSLVVE